MHWVYLFCVWGFLLSWFKCAKRWVNKAPAFVNENYVRFWLLIVTWILIELWSKLHWVYLFCLCFWVHVVVVKKKKKITQFHGENPWETMKFLLWHWCGCMLMFIFFILLIGEGLQKKAWRLAICSYKVYVTVCPFCGTLKKQGIFMILNHA